MARRVLVSDSLGEEGLERLRAAPALEVDYRPGLDEAALTAAIAGAEALVVRSGSRVTARVIEAGDRLRVIGRAGIGVDNVDLAAASRRGIVVMNTPTGNAVTTAEHTLALLLALARHVPQAAAALAGGRWEKKAFEGRELAGKTLGVIGLGNIGRIVAERARGLRMEVIGFDPVLTAERAVELGLERVTLDELWARADAITVHTPLTAATRNLVDDAVVARLRPGVLLVNCARGGIYDEAALARGLAAGRIGGVALDVFEREPPPPDHPLLGHPRVIATPHLGASTREAQERVALEVAEQVVAFLERGEVRNALNLPAVSADLAPRLAPWLDLAQRLGAFLAQMQPPLEPRSIEVECCGEPAGLGASTIGASALAGYLERALGEPVNAVAAPLVAADRGLAYGLRTEEAARGTYAALVGVALTGADGARCAVEGTLGGDRSPRLSRWDDFAVEARLQAPALVVTSIDRPGVVGALGTRLGEAGVNVAHVNLGRSASGGRAVSVWNLDHAPDDQLLATLRQLSHVTDVKLFS